MNWLRSSAAKQLKAPRDLRRTSILSWAFALGAPSCFQTELKKNSFRFLAGREGKVIILKYAQSILFSLEVCPWGKQCYLTIQLRFYKSIMNFQEEKYPTSQPFSCSCLIKGKKKSIKQVWRSQLRGQAH